jgi:dTDP-4-dehydrorhamnose 3,5-epimerase-like enzyme
VPFEFRELPFVPRRVYTVQSVPVGTIRGRHALLSQRQILICVSGQIDVRIRSHDWLGAVTLDQPDTGLLVEPGVWTSQEFMFSGTVLLVMASAPHDPNGYVAEPDIDRG